MYTKKGNSVRTGEKVTN